MFDRTFAALSRLVGWGKGATVEEDRRVKGRHSCDVATTCAHASKPHGPRLAAHVHNISLGGMNLIVSERFDPGELLNLQLPDANPPTTVLACVIWADDLKDGTWSLGCSFSAELTPADLELFEPEHPAERGGEQRAAERFPSRAAATFARVNDDHSSRALSAQVVNLSLNGVALRCPASLDTGELLSLELRDDSDQIIAILLACVVRISPQPDGEWLIGCNFLGELTEEQLRALT
jgi:hypothetical protein